MAKTSPSKTFETRLDEWKSLAGQSMHLPEDISDVDELKLLKETELAAIKALECSVTTLRQIASKIEIVDFYALGDDIGILGLKILKRDIINF